MVPLEGDPIRSARRTGAPVHRRAALGLAAHLVARRVRLGDTALRAAVGEDPRSAARARDGLGRGDLMTARPTNSTRLLVALLLALAGLLAAACGGGGGTGATQSAEPGIGTKATFILANPGGLSALDDAGRFLGKIVKLPDQSAPSTPVLHPSGGAVAFALTQQPDAKRGFGSDIYTVNLDGTGLKPVLLHEDNNVFYASPRFDASGNVLYVHRRAAIIQNGSFVGNEDNIVRVDLRTMQSQKILKDGA